ncbi:hypothetical protein OPV22_017532 [Ensete ventricosum]|uniref:PB1 domain-containing protein n=1 Tax=Ensete ventricosum TaxID=4639 RepID=A0AAV8QY71_ENSVE|nr:hypothetical protein OPV22_017532 [Ensete ventricosum]
MADLYHTRDSLTAEIPGRQRRYQNRMESSGADSSSPSPPPPFQRDNLAPGWDDPPPPPSSSLGRVKLMVSYGGRIQLRPHDNSRLSYVGGETKILSLDRSARLPALLAKVASLARFTTPLCLKYQLPGEDLDALVSVTDDGDLDHMVTEYDCLCCTSSSKPSPRLRLFLFPGFVPAPAVKVTADPQQPPSLLESLPLSKLAKPDLAKDDPEQPIGSGADTVAPAPAPAADVVSAGEIQAQIPELHTLKIAENVPPPIPRNSSEETLRKICPLERHVSRAAENSTPAPPPSPALYWLEQSGATSGGRYTSLAPGGDQTVYLVPASPAVYPGFFPAVRSVEPSEAYNEAPAKVVGGMPGPEVYVGGQLAYGRVVYYPSVAPTFPTVTSVAFHPADKTVKPSA